MSGDEALELWLHEYKLDALGRVLTEHGTDTRTVLQAHLEELYRQYVPAQERVDINNRIEGERLAEERRAEESRRISAFRVAEHGQAQYFTTDAGHEFLDAAKRLRIYLTKEPSAPPDNFAGLFTHRVEITADQFNELVGIRMDNTGKVPGMFDIDFDKQEFSAVHIMDGWKTFAIGDVSAAVYHATRKHGLTDKQQWDRFLERLNGKEIISASHLSARNISFSEEINEMDDCLNFYLNADFDVDAVFGTEVCTSANDDWLNVYANYDMAAHEVYDTLDIELRRGDGGEETLSYPLNAAEKEVLRRKMDAYCREQTGMTLDEYSERHMAEEQSPLTEPTM